MLGHDKYVSRHKADPHPDGIIDGHEIKTDLLGIRFTLLYLLGLGWSFVYIDWLYFWLLVLNVMLHNHVFWVSLKHGVLPLDCTNCGIYLLQNCFSKWNTVLVSLTHREQFCVIL